MTNSHFKKGTGGEIKIETDMTLARIDWNRFRDSLTMDNFPVWNDRGKERKGDSKISIMIDQRNLGNVRRAHR